MGLSQHTARSVAGDCLISCVDAHKVIWPQGAKIQSWDLVLSGIVAVSQQQKPNDCRLVHFFSNGSWYGEQHILSDSPTCLTFHTLDQVDLLRLPSSIFIRLLENEPAFARFIAKLAALKGQLLWDGNIFLKSGSPTLRVLGGLGLCSESFISTAFPHMGDIERDSLRIPLKQELLAHYCGVSRTIFSQHLQTLMAHGLINIEYSEIEIVGLQQWRKILNFLKANMTTLSSGSLDDVLSACKESIQIRPLGPIGA